MSDYQYTDNDHRVLLATKTQLDGHLLLTIGDSEAAVNVRIHKADVAAVVSEILKVAGQAASEVIAIVFDGPPAHQSGRFVEVEDASGASINAGEWSERVDGLWELKIEAPKSRTVATDDLVAQVARADVREAHHGWLIAGEGAAFAEAKKSESTAMLRERAANYLALAEHIEETELEAAK